MYSEVLDFHEFETADEELAQLSEEFRNGQLDRLAPCVATFAKAQLEELPLEARNESIFPNILTTVKQRIVQVRSIDCRSEMKDQLKAINDEIWIQGERGEYDRNKIVYDWTCKHAENWRQWRIKEYLYLIDQRNDLIKSLLCNPS